MKLRTPSPSMVVAIIAVVLSLTGAADAARNAVVAAIKGHPVSSKPLAGGILLLGKNRKFPPLGDPGGRQRPAPGRQNRRTGGRYLHPGHHRRRHLLHRDDPRPAHPHRIGKASLQLH